MNCFEVFNHHCTFFYVSVMPAIATVSPEYPPFPDDSDALIWEGTVVFFVTTKFSCFSGYKEETW